MMFIRSARLRHMGAIQGRHELSQEATTITIRTVARTSTLRTLEIDVLDLIRRSGI